MNSLDIESHGNIANRQYDIASQIPNIVQYPIPDFVPYPVSDVVTNPETNSNSVVVPISSDIVPSRSAVVPISSIIDPSTSVAEPITSAIKHNTSLDIPNIQNVPYVVAYPVIANATARPNIATSTPNIANNDCNHNRNCYRVLYIIFIIAIFTFPLVMILLPEKEEYTFKQVDISISQISTSTFLFNQNAEALNHLTRNIVIVNEDFGNYNYKVYYTFYKYCQDSEVSGDCSFIYYVNGVENIQRTLLAYQYNYYEHTFLGTETRYTKNPGNVEKPLSEISVIGTTIYIIYAIIIIISIICFCICRCCGCYCCRCLIR